MQHYLYSAMVAIVLIMKMVRVIFMDVIMLLMIAAGLTWI